MLYEVITPVHGADRLDVGCSAEQLLVPGLCRRAVRGVGRHQQSPAHGLVPRPGEAWGTPREVETGSCQRRPKPPARARAK